ncbi:MAG: 30S ribosomal protein S6 [Rickettsiaceae bacterium H1]|nr:30S ribosomal protein S6 [Rickettsiaceae bacterium H1]
MYKYEYSFIAHQGLSDNEVTRLMGNLCSTLETGGAKILKQEYWGLLDLAYKINKQEKGHYFMLCIESDSGNLSDFKKKLKLNDLVMRYLELRRDEIVEGDSPMMKVEGENDEKE